MVRNPVREETAIRLVTRAAQESPQRGCPYCDHVCGDSPGAVVSVMRGGLRFTWSLEDALGEVSSADEVLWVADDVFGHRLWVRRGEKWTRFSVGVGTESTQPAA